MTIRPGGCVERVHRPLLPADLPVRRRRRRRPPLLAVNGTSRADRLLFTGTGGWGSYRTVSFNALLQAGNNTITLAFDSGRNSSNRLNLDRLNVT